MADENLERHGRGSLTLHQRETSDGGGGGITCSSTPMQDTKERKENQEVLVRRVRRCAGSRKH